MRTLVFTTCAHTPQTCPVVFLPKSAQTAIIFQAEIRWAASMACSAGIPANVAMNFLLM
jgi:hypothetical protein